MRNYKEHLISREATLKEALQQLNDLAKDAILFVVDENESLLGSLTDGDVRRGLLKGNTVNDKVVGFIQSSPRHIKKADYSIKDIIQLRENHFKVLPVLDEDGRIVNVVNFGDQKSYLPLDALVMAGGVGSRLMPLTANTPKPLLKVGDKAIIDHNVDRLRNFGVDDFYISVRYLGEQLEEHYRAKDFQGIKMNFIWEDEPLGTLGAASKIKSFQHDYVLVTNSDILTTLDYEDFFLDFLDKNADMAVATIPYQVNVPYAVMETSNDHVISFKEKPTYTYYSNGGIYIIKRAILENIPKETFYNTTDLMEQIIKDGGKLISYPIRQYWLDIGKHEDFKKAQEDINHLDL